ncbi:chemotaxis protein [Sporomusa acidovorans]|uniref:Chemotaxis protein CheV n=1 Tax=Sporomusa acidovorans (strain ATCC 49682 / DSM 3132 / Mol) TaxID=1123286 RepID=A0ABZ3IW16_SPOA4|nr:chemotaxis protein [Sporomusa acidovorans]OZC23878.1 chemotaxis protein CheV [Sporomusa acidovorans DSM 3132]SDF54761.1 two-component system, chemotaxis family, response regulator CheV [Sporomusa acidovorans]
MGNNKGILLESGTNEFEIIEFSIGNVFYGINVAKVREIINLVPITAVPNAHSYIDGIITLRGKIMPLVNLAKCLSSETQAVTSKIIVTEMNGVFSGFKVDEVSRIHRISWKQMEPAPNISDSDRVVGIVKMENRLIILLDFEKILSEVNPEIGKKLSAIPVSSAELVTIRKTKTILVAEDSHMLRELLLKTLQTAGYNTISADNGQQAWNKLEAIARNGKSVVEQIQLVITDIEMPQMDGHHLTKRIKEDQNLRALPVIIFSSLINEEMRRKGEALGAYAQITKPEIEQLISIVDKKIAM